MTQEIARYASAGQFKMALAGEYQKQINNFFGDEKKALKFLSSAVTAIQMNPKLLECEPSSLVNSFLKMAQLEFMPSDISGEAYVLPYLNSKNINGTWEKVTEAQFQLGYQGIITMFYRSGIRSVVAEIVYKNDKFKYVNGNVEHEPDIFSEDRGEAIGAYVIVELPSGSRISKVMSRKQILDIAKKFSKSYSTKFSPWQVDKDPELWMWRKTVLRQVAKLVPKNESLVKAIAEDDKDSTVSDKKPEENTRLIGAMEKSDSLRIGNHVKPSPSPIIPEEKDENGEKLPVIHIEE